MSNPSMIDRRLSVAPMMDCTDKHDRYFLRLIAPQILLYTEMITTGALIHGDSQRFLAFHPLEQPLAIQLGGNDPSALALCAQQAEQYGYNEINLNVGCPSDRVKSGRFGACLMLEASLVADCVAAMCRVVKIPVTVKCRIGVDHHDSFAELCGFIETVASAGCKVFIIHARKAWLNGLSPKENREIPPLRYDVVKNVKQVFPHLKIILNGGIKTLETVQELLPHVDGVMIGREAYANPYFLSALHAKVYEDSQPLLTREEVIQSFLPYIEHQLANNIKLSSITRHIVGLFHGQPGARAWRRYLSENAHLASASVDIVTSALQRIIKDQSDKGVNY